MSGCRWVKLGSDPLCTICPLWAVKIKRRQWEQTTSRPCKEKQWFPLRSKRYVMDENTGLFLFVFFGSFHANCSAGTVISVLWPWKAATKHFVLGSCNNKSGPTRRLIILTAPWAVAWLSCRCRGSTNQFLWWHGFMPVHTCNWNQASHMSLLCSQLSFHSLW